MTTEADAKVKWCPVRQMKPCEASKCMAWRWLFETVTPDGIAAAGASYVQRSDHGYCGLAGKP